MHSHSEGVEGDPLVHTKFSFASLQSFEHPPFFLSSHNSFPKTNPSPQIGKHKFPEAMNPFLHEQTLGVVEDPGIHVKFE